MYGELLKLIVENIVNSFGELEVRITIYCQEIWYVYSLRICVMLCSIKSHQG
jgi:hypothetical protein